MNKERIKQIMGKYYGISAGKIDTINRFFLRQSYLIHSDNGCIVLKKYPPDFTEEELLNIWDFTSALKRNGIPTMQVLEMKDKSVLFKDHDAYLVSYKYIEGRVMTPKESFEIGKALRNFHTKSKIISSYESFNTFKKRICVEQVIENIEKFRLYREDSHVAKRIDDNIDLFVNCIKEYHIVDNMLIHGDFTLNNVLKNGEEKYIIDLDLAYRGNAIEDLACFTLSLLYTGSDNFELIMRIKEISNFLFGYYDNMCVSKKMVDELVFSLKLHCIVEIARQAQNFLVAKRYPGNEAYTGMLADVVILKADILKEQLYSYIFSNGDKREFVMDDKIV